MHNIPKLDNTAFLQYTIHVNRPIHEIFNYFISGGLSRDYSKISSGHKYFILRGEESIKEGVLIDCEERAGNQEIKHEYKVTEIINNERIAYCSIPSKLIIKLPWKSMNSQSNTFVYYDFEDKDQTITSIRLTIGIQFSSRFEKGFSTFFGGLAPWKKHCKEEMEGLKKILTIQQAA